MPECQHVRDPPGGAGVAFGFGYAFLAATVIAAAR